MAPKSPEVRAREARALSEQLEEQPLPDEVRAPILDALREFAANGVGFTRVVRIPGTPLVVDCIVSTQAHIVSHIRIGRRRVRHG